MSLGQQYQAQSSWLPTHVQVTVLQSRGLRSKGKAGTNDAYAIIQLGKEKYSTTVAEKSHAPVWKEEATFELPLLHQDHRGRGTLRLIIMHRALVGLDKHLGEVGLDLYQLHQERSRRKTQWYKLQSKPGKKAKERGEIELDVQFMRNNMTASMFDLSMKEKSRSPFGKLKDKMKGKRHDGFPDTASAIVPSFTQPGADSDEEGPEKVTKKKSKLKNLFSKPGLQKSPLSQSMLVLPSFQPSPLAERKVLRPSDFSSDFNDVPLSTDEPAPNKVEGKPPHFPVIMTHKRTVSADTKQINQIVPGTNKKEGLSFFSGLRSKNDPITRSNVCINGNHVYNEETEPKPDVQAKDNTLSFTPKIIRKTPIYSSIEDLSTKSSSSESLSSKITVEAFEPASSLPDKRSSWALSKDSLKSMTLPSFKPSNGEESQEANLVGSSDPTKEAKESKKPESLKSSLLSLVTGKKEVSKDLSKGEAVTQTSVKEEQLKSEDISPKHSADVSPQHSSVVASTEIPSPKESLNPFEEDLKQDEQKPVPLPPSTRTPKTTAVKPRLDVSSEAETKAKLFPPSVTGPSHSPSMFLSSNMDDSFASVPALSARRHPTNTDHNVNLCSPVDPSDSLPLSSAVNLPFPSETLPAKGVSPSNQLADGSSLLASEHLTLPSQGEPETKEVLPVPQFNNQMSSNKTTVRSLLDQLKGKKADTGGERLERAGKLESQASGPNPKSFQEKNQELAPGKDGVNEFTASPENHAERLDFAESNHSQSKAEAISHVRDISSSFIPNQMKTSIPLDNVQNQTDVLPSDLIFPKMEGRTPHIKDGALKFEDADLPNVNFDNEYLVKDLDQNIQPKPMPRTQIASPKVTTEEDFDLPLHAVPTPPKPAPRSVVKNSRNAANPIASVVTPVYGPPKPLRALTTSVKDGSSFEHYGPIEKDELEYVYIKDSEMKMASPALVDFKFTLNELPVIPENPEVMSDDDLAPCQASIPVQEPSDAGLSARTVPHSVAEKATNPAKTSVDQKVTREVKENPHDGKLKKQNLSFKSSRSQSSNVAVETNENIDFTNECEPTFNHVQESNALSDLSNNQVNNYPQKADSSAVFPSSTSALNSSISLPSNPSRAKEADSPTRPPAVGTDRAESTGKKKLLRAWVSPSETPPIQAPPSAAVPATLRPHPVKPMSTNPVKASSFGTAIKQENAFMEPKKYDPSDPAASYGQLTHDELIKLVLKQKDTITKKESQVQELEEYIDNLLVRVMEEMPNILISMAEDSKKSGKV